MIKPHLVDLNQFKPKPPKPIIETPQEIQSKMNWYMNIVVIGVIILGCYFLYRKYKYKEVDKRKYNEDVIELAKYL